MTTIRLPDPVTPTVYLVTHTGKTEEWTHDPEINKDHPVYRCGDEVSGWAGLFARAHDGKLDTIPPLTRAEAIAQLREQMAKTPHLAPNLLAAHLARWGADDLDVRALAAQAISMVRR